MSPPDSTGSPLAYVVKTRRTCSTPRKALRADAATTRLQACAADMTPAGSELPPPVPVPPTAVPHPAAATAAAASRPPIRCARFPVMTPTHHGTPTASSIVLARLRSL